ncbi:hypothetical protein [Lichenicoccus sp.]|uniref:hypothetical protein n=1 Tax=Lichenicoccus sp. TaxID=2781899 RepID=UPI003D0F5A96
MGSVIPFPAPVVRLHIVPLPQPTRPLLVVEHDGALYSLATLLARLPDTVLDELDAMVPASAQEAWDWVVRHWPRVAEQAARRAGEVQSLR